MFKEFKKFLLRGNVVDMAVGVIIGAAFGTVVNALVAGILTPCVSAIVKVPDFSTYTFTINGSTFLIGYFLNALISFVLVAFAIFFFVVKPMNIVTEINKKKDGEAPTTKTCPECLSEIPLEAKRCSHCTQIVP